MPGEGIDGQNPRERCCQDCCQSCQNHQSFSSCGRPGSIRGQARTTGKVKVAAPQTGADYLASLSDGREVFIYGERVKDVTKHQAFRNTASMVARLYDALHDPKRKDRNLRRPRPATAA